MIGKPSKCLLDNGSHAAMISKSSREVELAADKVFRSAGYPWKLFCGPLVIEADLASAVRRQGASKAFVICSPSINSKTDIVYRIKAALGTVYCGCFDGVENDSTYLSVVAEIGRAHV